MEYKFSEIEEKIKQYWKEKDIYRVGDADSGKPKYYVLDMFPYPSGAGLHVGHPLGYIASDIYARYKRMKGFNVLHPMGYDSFGLPAEQYAIQTGQHPAITTEQNIATFRKQMDQLGFSFDWSREVRTSDPEFYRWTQWIFIQLFHSWYNNASNKAEPIENLVKELEVNGNKNINAAGSQAEIFTAEEWKNFSPKQQSDVLLNYRIAYIADSWVNWCPALGTVLANDEVKDGVSERGGYRVERKLMKQWSMRITAYADRLLDGLDNLDWSESIKETQRNWIGKSEGCSVRFDLDNSNGAPATPLLGRGARGEDKRSANDGHGSEEQKSIDGGGDNSPLFGRGAGGEDEKSANGGKGDEAENTNDEYKLQAYLTANKTIASELLKFGKENRKAPTEAEELLWSNLRNRKLGDKFRRQHPIGNFIVDFVCLSKKLIIELDGEQHKENKEYDILRTNILNELGYKVIRFWNEKFLKDVHASLEKIKKELAILPDMAVQEKEQSSVLTPGPSPKERGSASAQQEDLGRASIEVFTTRPDTIFGVTFLTLAPEHELINRITPSSHKEEVEKYVTYAKNRSERERMSDVKNITGQFTGAYAIHPFTGKQVPIWIGEYVLAGYGTGAVMGVPAHDSRDYAFAKHFKLDILEVVKGGDINKEAYEGEGINVNSSFLDGLKTPEAKKKAIDEIEKKGIGKRKINFKLRDAIFGRQRYWGEPIPIYYVPAEASAEGGGEQWIPYTVDEDDLPLVLPQVDKYLPTEDGEPPLARASHWTYEPEHIPQLWKGATQNAQATPLLRRSMPHPDSLREPPLPEGEGGSPSQKPGYQTSNAELWGVLKENAKHLRKEQTEAERILWEQLRDNKLGYKIRRQHPIGNYIADFICLEKKLVIEVDGGIHLQQKEYDEKREIALQNMGFKVIRFTNEVVLKDVYKIAHAIKFSLASLPSILNDDKEEGDKNQPEGGISPLQPLENINQLTQNVPPLPRRGVTREASRGEALSAPKFYPLELTTMPGWAGSSWYYLRYEDPHDSDALASAEKINYWKNIDFYIGGAEHSTGHLIYFRFWTKFLFDLGIVPFEEPAKRLVNQGMIQGQSALTELKSPELSALAFKNNFDFNTAPYSKSYKDYALEYIKDSSIVEKIRNVYVSWDFESNQEKANEIYGVKALINLPIDYADLNNKKYNIKSLHDSGDYRAKDTLFIFRGGIFLNGKFYFDEGVNENSFNFLITVLPEKMSKSKYNVVNPDDIVSKYGADCFRMYEMFLGPLELSKPWDTKGIDGVSRFLRKLWRLFYDEAGNWIVTGEAATNEELKPLHKTIKKTEDDMERLSFNTSVSSFMICVNTLTDLKCHKAEVLKDLLLIMAPMAPFTTEFLWGKLGQEGSIVAATFPKVRKELLVENVFEYPIAINGKTRGKIELALDLTQEVIEKEVLALESVQKFLEGKTPKKVIVVKGRMVNVVV